jgi:ATP-dependent protease ClpP protease subunit
MNRAKIIAALKAKKVAFDESASTPVLNALLRGTWLTVRNTADIPDYSGGDYDCEMTIHGQIGTDYYGDQGYSAKQFQDEIKPFANKKVLLNIHSPGGNIWDAFAISEMARQHGNVDTKILGLAASSGDLIFQAGKTRIMPRMAMRMAHNPSSLFIASGNAEELTAQKAEFDKTIGRLQKHGETLAKMYAERTGQTVDECKADMNAEEFMDGDESLEKGYCDQLSDDMPVTDALDLSHLKKVPTQILNQFHALPTQGERPRSGINNQTNQPQENTVNKTQKIALLNKWGVKLPAGITAETVQDKWLDDEIDKGKPAEKIGRDQNVALLNQWGVTFDKNITDADLETLVSKGKPAAAAAVTAAPVVDLDNHPVVLALKAQADGQRRTNLHAQIMNLASVEGGSRIPLNSVDKWLERAVAAKDDPTTGNPVVADLKALDERKHRLPLVESVFQGEVGPKELLKAISNALAPRTIMDRNPGAIKDKEFRKDVFASYKGIGKMLRVQIENVTKGIPESSEQGISSVFNKRRAEAIGNWMDGMPAIMNDSNAGPYGGITVSSDLQRQVIMSESMRAFQRRLLPLGAFAHTFNEVPLQGKDEIDVPYYPLFTTQSQRFISPGAAGAAAGTTGYQFSGTDQEFRKQILVGGVGPNNKVAGQDRAYQPLTYSAYLQRRQPWVDVQKLAVMRTEQLAIDVLNDIITAWVLKANFANAVWAGAPAGFDDTTVAFLAGVARKSDWPEAMRNLVIGTDYWVNLASSPYVKAFLNIGTTDTIREGRIGGLYGFEDTIENPRIPVTADGNLVGFICYPSAVLVATSPIMPGPGEMKNMVSYDIAVDDQTGLAFEYKYWGEPWNSADREIIECNYGSGLGELAALKRLVAQGN